MLSFPQFCEDRQIREQTSKGTSTWRQTEWEDRGMHPWRQAWQSYENWARSSHGPDPRPTVEIMADIEFLYQSMPESVRVNDPDPEKKGIQAMREVWSRYEQSRTSARASR